MDSHDVRPKVPGNRSHKYFSPAALGTVASKQGGVTARIDTRDRLTRQMWLSTLKLLDIVAKELKVIPAYAAVALIVIYAAPSMHRPILCCNIDSSRTTHHIPLQLMISHSKQQDMLRKGNKAPVRLGCHGDLLS